MLPGLDGRIRLRVGDVGERFAVEFFCDLGERRVVGVRVGEGRVQNGIGELAAFLLIEVTNLQEDGREDFLVEPRLAGRWNGNVLPLQPARGVHERAVFFREACSRQAVHGGVDLLHVVRGDAGGAPEFAGLVGINFANHQPVGFFQGVDILIRIGADHDAVHAEGEDAFDLALVHVIPDIHPGMIAVDLRQIVEGPVVFFGGRWSVHRFQKRDGEF